MLKLTQVKIIALLTSSLLLSACANQNVIPFFQSESDRLAEQSRILEAEITAKNAELELVKSKQQPPLFTYMDPSADPFMWTNEQNTDAIPGTKEAMIVGRLPGQRELPFALYEEAAVPHNIGQRGTVLYLNNDEEENIWDRIRNGYDLPYQKNARIDTHLRWYSKHQSYLNRVAKRADKYLYVIVEEAEKTGVPMEIA
ncbi:MAG: hypothetical protein OEX07_03620, partial [Gammaproteobacteria bacterium]|nr:hypothetical protein [Gammaproteobacteria bacterium]